MVLHYQDQYRCGQLSPHRPAALVFGVTVWENATSSDVTLAAFASVGRYDLDLNVTHVSTGAWIVVPTSVVLNHRPTASIIAVQNITRWFASGEDEVEFIAVDIADQDGAGGGDLLERIVRRLIWSCNSS